MPKAEDLDLDGLDVSVDDVAKALAVNPDEWREELPQIEEWFEFVGEKLPTGVRDEFEALKQRLSGSRLTRLSPIQPAVRRAFFSTYISSSARASSSSTLAVSKTGARTRPTLAESR